MTTTRTTVQATETRPDSSAVDDCRSLRAECARLERELAIRDAALNASSTYFVIIDVTEPSRPIVFANRSFAHDHGYEPEDLIGRSILPLASPVGNEAAREQLEAALSESRDARVELVARRRDGSTFVVGIQLRPLVGESGDLGYYVCVGTDITARLESERRKRELQEQLHNEIQERERLAIELRLAQKLESVGRLAAGVAHEINTPIQYVGDSVHFLRNSVLDLEELLTRYDAALTLAYAHQPLEQARADIEAFKQTCDLDFVREEIPRAFDRTLDGVERVTHIVKAMKEFAHPDENAQAMSDVNHAIETTLTMAHNEYKYLARVVTDLGELPQVMCNIGELNQVFLNLIVNAAHAVEASGKDANEGTISITTRQRRAHVEISIADNGCGIKPEDQERIFDPFFTTKEVGKGTGQGLTIARAIVERHKGSLEFESRVGAGTTFTISLPVAGQCATEMT